MPSPCRLTVASGLVDGRPPGAVQPALFYRGNRPERQPPALAAQWNILQGANNAVYCDCAHAERRRKILQGQGNQCQINQSM